MDRLTVFGLVSVTGMLVTYALEARSRWTRRQLEGTLVSACRWHLR